MANPILLGKTGLDKYVTDSFAALGTKYGITIPVRTEGWFALRQTVEDAEKLLSVATGSTVMFDISSPTALGLSLAAGIPVLLAASVGASLTDLRTATLAKVLSLTMAEQATSRQDAAALALVPGAVTGAATLPNLYTQQSNPGVFEAFGGAPLATTDPRLWVIVQMDDAPNTGGGMNVFMPGGKYYWQFSTEWRTRVVNTRYVEIATKDSTAGLRLWVNGRLAIDGKQPFINNAGAGDLSYTKFDLGAVGSYDIDIEMNGAIRFYGVLIDAGGSCVKQTRASTGTILCLGDSYTSGASYTAVRGQDLMRTVGRYLGFHNVVTAGLSGSSMVTSTGTKKWDVSLGAGSSIYLDFVQPVLKPVIDPDVVIIALGYNDNGSSGPTVTALQALWAQVRTDFPRALIVCMGMWGGVIQARSTLQSREENIRTAFNAWADPLSLFVRLQFATGGAAQSAVQFGQGYTGTPSYDGINDLILNGDRNHLNDGYANQDGQWYMATKIRDAILTELNAMGATYNPSNTKAAYWPLSLKLAGGQVTTAAVGSPFRFSIMSTGGGFPGALPGTPTSLPAKVHSILAGGTIPPGLVLNATQAMLTGTPTTAGTYNFTVHCVDNISGATADLPCTIVVS